jgi:hypothetical protein
MLGGDNDNIQIDTDLQTDNNAGESSDIFVPPS